MIQQIYRLGTGPFALHLETDVPAVSDTFERLYAGYPSLDGQQLFDYHVALRRAGGPRRWYRPQGEFSFDGRSPFAPFPLDHGFALLEWGLNWSIATTAHQYLMLHAGVVEKNGEGIIMPAWPAAGKSTLTAALVYRGWRLFSDEFGLLEPGTNRLWPLPRPMPLKNESIQVMRDYAPEAELGPTFTETRKGNVAHLRVPVDSLRRMGEPAAARYVIFPRYEAGRRTWFEPLAKARAFMKLSGNSFNYELLGAVGFETVAEVIDACDCFLFHYSDLDEAVSLFNGLVS